MRSAARIVLIPSIIALLVAANAAAAGDTVYVYSVEQTAPAVRPSSLQFLMGGGSFMTYVHWRSWGSATAVGQGTFNLNTCRPDCASGHVLRNPGTIRLSRRKRCGGGHYYSRAAVTYRARGRNRSGSRQMGNPFTPC